MICPQNQLPGFSAVFWEELGAIGKRVCRYSILTPYAMVVVFTVRFCVPTENSTPQIHRRLIKGLEESRLMMRFNGCVFVTMPFTIADVAISYFAIFISKKSEISGSIFP